ncbi:MAG TPA: arginine--tRNA ligase, partial [Actinomycetota bacterium]
MADLEELLRERLAGAFEAVAGEVVDPAVHRSQHADYQSDAALALSRKLGDSPRAIAERVLQHARLDDICTKAEVSGPGFINLTVANETLGELLSAVVADQRLGVAPSP